MPTVPSVFYVICLSELEKSKMRKRKKCLKKKLLKNNNVTVRDNIGLKKKMLIYIQYSNKLFCRFKKDFYFEKVH